MSRTDAHLHVWDLSTDEYAWPDESVPEIRRTVALEEASPLLRAAGYDRAILVQAADSAAETRRLLELADRNPFVAAVVGWVPLDRPDDAEHLLAEFAAHRAFAGVRALIHGYTDPAWILRPATATALDRLAARGLAYEVVTADPVGLALVPRLARRHPGLVLVIDHLGKPPIGGDASDRRRWRDALARAAEHPQVVAKLSGLYRPVHRPADASEIRPFVDDALDLFGPDRLMAGSDWPVCELAGGYHRVMDAVHGAIASLSPGERDLVCGGTAAHIYRFDERRATVAEGTAG